MLEKPSIPDEQILACLREQYGLPVNLLTFLPLGVDPAAAVYRATTSDNTAYFLKLRRGPFDDLAAQLSAFLRAKRGVVTFLVDRADQLALALQARSHAGPEFGDALSPSGASLRCAHAERAPGVRAGGARPRLSGAPQGCGAQ